MIKGTATAPAYITRTCCKPSASRPAVARIWSTGWISVLIGRALKLPPEDVAFLISADLFACGLATLVQCTPASDDGRHLCFVFGILAALVYTHAG
jgi:xanthine/uracil permease